MTQPSDPRGPLDPGRPAEAGRPALTACSLCAGETLGDADLRPGGQLDRLRALESSGVAGVTLVECLDECERGDVVVVRPSGPGRRAGGRSVWFERLAGDDATDALGTWLADGGPGRAPVPDVLRPCRIRRGADRPA